MPTWKATGVTPSSPKLTRGLSTYAAWYSVPFARVTTGPNAPMKRSEKCHPSLDQACPPQGTPCKHRWCPVLTYIITNEE